MRFFVNSFLATVSVACPDHWALELHCSRSTRHECVMMSTHHYVRWRESARKKLFYVESCANHFKTTTYVRAKIARYVHVFGLCAATLDKVLVLCPDVSVTCHNISATTRRVIPPLVSMTCTYRQSFFGVREDHFR